MSLTLTVRLGSWGDLLKRPIFMADDLQPSVRTLLETWAKKEIGDRGIDPLRWELETFRIDGFTEEPEDHRDVYVVLRERTGRTAVCDNCGSSLFFDGDDLTTIPDLTMRLDPGGIVPARECPHCGALAYPG